MVKIMAQSNRPQPDSFDHFDLASEGMSRFDGAAKLRQILDDIQESQEATSH
jgi:hypothetical protein